MLNIDDFSQRGKLPSVGQPVPFSTTDIQLFEGEPRIHDLRLAEVLGFERMRNIRQLVERHSKALEKFGDLFCCTVQQNTRGRPSQEYWLNEKQALYICTKSDLPTAVDVTVEMVEAFHAVKSGKPKGPTLPDFSNPADAARAWATQYEARVLAEKTKAEIGTRREATAMNTASQAVKRANKLELQLDQSQEYATIKRMTMLYHGQQFSWRELKHVSVETGKMPIDVFDANYGTVKAYHRDVWWETYALDIPETGRAA